MSHSIITSIRALALGAVLLVAGRLPAAKAQDVTPERALLNGVPAPRATPTAFLERSSAWARHFARPVTGEAALLARVEEAVPPVRTPIGNAGPVDGTRALLGRWSADVAPLTSLSAGSQ